jgi:hypothetical protein
MIVLIERQKDVFVPAVASLRWLADRLHRILGLDLVAGRS